MLRLTSAVSTRALATTMLPSAAAKSGAWSRFSRSTNVMAKTPKNEDASDEQSPAETERIAAKTLKNILSRPPKPFTKSAKAKKGAE